MRPTLRCASLARVLPIWHYLPLRTFRLGRYVNDGVGEETNAKMCKLGTSTPHLALFATKPIQIGEEIRYDYGAKDLWRRKTVGHYATIGG